MALLLHASSKTGTRRDMEVKGETAAVRDPSLRELENTYYRCLVHLKRTWHLAPIIWTGSPPALHLCWQVLFAPL